LHPHAQTRKLEAFRRCVSRAAGQKRDDQNPHRSHGRTSDLMNANPHRTPFVPAAVALLAAALAAGLGRPRTDDLKPFQQEVVSTAYKIDMLPIPGDKDGKIKPFWMAKTEVTWDAFDVYAFRLDEGESGGTNVDAV